MISFFVSAFLFYAFVSCHNSSRSPTYGWMVLKQNNEQEKASTETCFRIIVSLKFWYGAMTASHFGILSFFVFFLFFNLLSPTKHIQQCVSIIFVLFFRSFCYFSSLVVLKSGLLSYSHFCKLPSFLFYGSTF